MVAPHTPCLTSCSPRRCPLCHSPAVSDLFRVQPQLSPLTVVGEPRGTQPIREFPSLGPPPAHSLHPSRPYNTDMSPTPYSAATNIAAAYSYFSSSSSPSTSTTASHTSFHARQVLMVRRNFPISEAPSFTQAIVVERVTFTRQASQCRPPSSPSLVLPPAPPQPSRLPLTLSSTTLHLQLGTFCW